MAIMIYLNSIFQIPSYLYQGGSKLARLSYHTVLWIAEKTGIITLIQTIANSSFFRPSPQTEMKALLTREIQQIDPSSQDMHALCTKIRTLYQEHVLSSTLTKQEASASSLHLFFIEQAKLLQEKGGPSKLLGEEEISKFWKEHVQNELDQTFKVLMKPDDLSLTALENHLLTILSSQQSLEAFTQCAFSLYKSHVVDRFPSQGEGNQSLQAQAILERIQCLNLCKRLYEQEEAEKLEEAKDSLLYDLSRLWIRKREIGEIDPSIVQPGQTISSLEDEKIQEIGTFYKKSTAYPIDGTKISPFTYALIESLQGKTKISWILKIDQCTHPYLQGQDKQKDLELLSAYLEQKPKGLKSLLLEQQKRFQNFTNTLAHHKEAIEKDQKLLQACSNVLSYALQTKTGKKTDDEFLKKFFSMQCLLRPLSTECRSGELCTHGIILSLEEDRFLFLL